MGNVPPQKSVSRPFQRQTRITPYTKKGMFPRLLPGLIEAKLSPLIKLIARREWQKVLIRISLFPSETAQTQKMTWYGVEWTILPLHLACALQPPYVVIEKLLLLHPRAASIFIYRTGRKTKRLLQRSRYRFRPINEVDNRSSTTEDVECANGSMFFSIEEDDSRTSSTSGQGFGEKSSSQMRWNFEALLDKSHSFLPLHIACLFQASHFILSQLIKAYPDGIETSANSWGMLPIHILCAKIDIPPPICRPSGSFLAQKFEWNLPPALDVLVKANRGSVTCPCEINGMTARDYLEEVMDNGSSHKLNCLEILSRALVEGSRSGSVTTSIEDEESSSQSVRRDETEHSTMNDISSPIPEEIEFATRVTDLVSFEISAPGVTESSPDDDDDDDDNDEDNISMVAAANVSQKNELSIYQDLIVGSGSEAVSSEWNYTISRKKAREWAYGIDMQDEVPQLRKRLPLHNACHLGAPASFIEMLLRAFPDAARCTDPYCGSLPVHLACQNENLSVDSLELLLEGFPRGIRRPDKKGRLPIHWLILNRASTAVIQTLLKAFPSCVSWRDNSGKTPYDYANENIVDSDILKLMGRLKGVLERVEDRRKQQEKIELIRGRLVMELESIEEVQSESM